jgi:stage V sporulation protein SpoVS
MSTSSLPQACLSHFTAERVRLHVPAMRMDRAYFARAREGLIAAPGVTRVSTNLRTASILIEHQDTIDVAALGTDLGLFQITPDEIHPPLSEALHRVAEAINTSLEDATRGRIDLTGATAVLYAALGLRQVARGDVLPAGLSLLWSAVSLLRKVEE